MASAMAPYVPGSKLPIKGLYRDILGSELKGLLGCIEGSLTIAHIRRALKGLGFVNIVGGI